MSTVELRKRIMEEIQKTDNAGLLNEVYRLLSLEGSDIEKYKLNDEQHSAIQEAREQYKAGKFQPSDQADKEIDEWLNE
jgi:hypothetical protein